MITDAVVSSQHIVISAAVSGQHWWP